MKKSKVSIFILAHQDDEFAAMHLLQYEKCKGNGIVIIYLSNGSNSNAALSNIRNLESQNALSKFTDNIVFLGGILNVNDGEIIYNLAVLYKKIYSLLRLQIESLDRIYTTAYEGGHQDHDAINLIVSKLSEKLKIAHKCFQFPIYHGKCMPFRFFKVVSTIDDNGPTYPIIVTKNLKIALLRSCFYYKSQVNSFIGLFPALVFKLTFCKALHIQHLSIFRTCKRPHFGKLLYEKMKKFEYTQFSLHANQFISEYESNLIYLDE